jgi:hypothetical protein
MSQKTLISYYQNKQKKDKRRISDLLSGRSSTAKAKRRAMPTSSATPAVAEESTSAAATSAAATSAAATSAAATSAAATSPFASRGESEMEDILISPLTIESGGESEESTLPLSRARKRRRTEKGREEQHSDGNFSKIFKISKYLIKIFYNI